MDDLDAVPNPEEDLKHAHMLLAQMSPEELLKATYALEEIIEQSPWFVERLNREAEEAKNGPRYTMEEVLADHGLTMKDLNQHAEPARQEDQAA